MHVENKAAPARWREGARGRCSPRSIWAAPTGTQVVRAARTTAMTHGLSPFHEGSEGGEGHPAKKGPGHRDLRQQGLLYWPALQ